MSTARSLLLATYPLIPISTVLPPLLIVPYAIVRVKKIGFVRVFTSPLPGDDQEA